MIGLLNEVAKVIAVILATILRMELEAAVRKNPARKYRYELVVGDAHFADAAGEAGVGDPVWLHILLQQTLKDFRQVAARNSRRRPDRMKESRATNLETVQPPRLRDHDEARRKTLRARLSAADIFRGTLHGRVGGLEKLAPENLSVNLRDSNVDRLACSCERVRETRCVVAKQDGIFLAWPPGLVGGRNASSYKREVDAQGRLAGIDLWVRR